MRNLWKRIDNFIFESVSGIVTDTESDMADAAHSSVYSGEREGKAHLIHATVQLEVRIITPENLDDAKEVVDCLKSENVAVINLQDISKEQAQNILNFISGATYALNGSIQRIAAKSFLTAPYNVEITDDVRAGLVNAQTNKFT